MSWIFVYFPINFDNIATFVSVDTIGLGPNKIYVKLMPDGGSQVKHSDIIHGIVDKGWHQQKQTASTMFQLWLSRRKDRYKILILVWLFNLFSIWPFFVADLAKDVRDYLLLMSHLGLTQISKTIVHHMTCGFVYVEYCRVNSDNFKKMFCIFCSEFTYL